MDVAAWRAYYTDAREFDSERHDWPALPDSGVLAVMVYFDEWTADGEVRYRKLYDGADWYWRDNGGQFHTAVGTLDDTDVSPGDTIVKEGEEIIDEAFAAVKRKAVGSTWGGDTRPQEDREDRGARGEK